jgi:hypothetical protein
MAVRGTPGASSPQPSPCGVPSAFFSEKPDAAGCAAVVVAVVAAVARRLRGGSAPLPPLAELAAVSLTVGNTKRWMLRVGLGGERMSHFHWKIIKKKLKKN